MLREIESEIVYDEEAKEAIERHQLDAAKAPEEQAKFDETQGDKKQQLDAFEAKRDMLIIEHEKATQEKDSAAVNKLKKLLEEKSSKQTEKSVKENIKKEYSSGNFSSEDAD